ncbi:hypothetical protein E4U57_005846 [Claviceps arundinis]|uniref:Metallothionein n=1 Tax=Claviceps arundinis TaxID=1623583 RepID=A0ABQ7PHN9_9HYPO|nr:hypothetical protein E4U57_005846 [Claviceps arundinis]
MKPTPTHTFNSSCSSCSCSGSCDSCSCTSCGVCLPPPLPTPFPLLRRVPVASYPGTKLPSQCANSPRRRRPAIGKQQRAGRAPVRPEVTRGHAVPR